MAGDTFWTRRRNVPVEAWRATTTTTTTTTASSFPISFSFVSNQDGRNKRSEVKQARKGSWLVQYHIFVVDKCVML